MNCVRQHRQENLLALKTKSWKKSLLTAQHEELTLEQIFSKRTRAMSIDAIGIVLVYLLLKVQTCKCLEY